MTKNDEQDHSAALGSDAQVPAVTEAHPTDELAAAKREIAKLQALLYGVAPDGREMRQIANLQAELKEKDKRLAALEAGLRQSDLIKWLPCKHSWEPITKAMSGLFLVTNNITARNASGQMSHVWIAPYGITVGDGITGPFTCLVEGWPNRVCGITHYQRIEPPEVETGNQAASEALGSVPSAAP